MTQKGAKGFIGEQGRGWILRTDSTGQSQGMQIFSRTNTMFMYRQSHCDPLQG
jgi:hypothetical protein